MTIKEFGLKLKLIFFPAQENNFRPKFLDSDFLTYYLAVLLIVKFAILPAFACFYQSSLFASITKEALVGFTNQERKSLGLGELRSNALLDQAAALKAQDMLALDYFSHNSPEGKTPWYWIKLAGYNYQKAGENLAIGFVDGEEVMQAWEDSPSHLANLINPGYKEIGIGVARGDFQGRQITVVVQMFGSKLSAKPTVAAKTADNPAKPSALAKKEAAAVSSTAAASQNLNAGGQTIAQPETIAQSEQNQTSSSGGFASSSAAEPAVEGVQSQPLTVPPVQVQNAEPGWKSWLMQFMAFDYSRIIEKINFFSLAAVMIGMMLNIFIKIKVQHKDLLLKGVFFIMVFGILLFFDKIIILRFIPHYLIVG